MYGEHDIIKTYFSCGQPPRKDIDTGIGDDCAIVESPHQKHLAITTDTLIEGTHFVKGARPKWIAYKALAASVSDLAAMGATPACCSLAITLPEVDKPKCTKGPLCFDNIICRSTWTKKILSLTFALLTFVTSMKICRSSKALLFIVMKLV